MSQRDYRLEQLVKDRRHAEGNPLREFDRRAEQIRAEATSAQDMERKLAELREEFGVFE